MSFSSVHVGCLSNSQRGALDHAVFLRKKNKRIELCLGQRLSLVLAQHYASIHFDPANCPIASELIKSIISMLCHIGTRIALLRRSTNWSIDAVAHTGLCIARIM
ncbi:hypothetical protein JOE33_001297 [Pseudomonas sp. PvP027]|uniref:hypothetical protein n=1 Tax=Pseudomonas TaxID=286 RepID=UPI0016567240|nr:MULTISPECIES: hypothetical protein [Pseudomonas]MBC8800261.1 hypothetical protein [Pseudomonas congelans]MBP1144374.1 hypothetical protein [Pseudomonas sp. PvP027]